MTMSESVETLTLPPLDWPAIVEAVELARRKRAESGLPGATVLRIDEATEKPLDWHVTVSLGAGRSAHRKRS